MTLVRFPDRHLRDDFGASGDSRPERTQLNDWAICRQTQYATVTLVAESSLAPDKVKLHWFERKRDGRTIVNSADLDEAGAFGDWPEDFDEIALQSESRYLDAARARRSRMKDRA